VSQNAYCVPGSGVAELNLRSVVDEITLEITAAGQTASDIEDAITRRPLAHIQHLIRNGTLIDGPDIDHVVEAILAGVLKQLMQIAESGGQIGTV
jgi:hypothetical protein